MKILMKKLKKNKVYLLKLKKGFTLIELLVVIAIIGILSAIVLASLGTAKSKGTTASNQVAEQQIKNALALYASDHDGNYPANTNALVAGKYISAINPSIAYTPKDSTGNPCSTESCFDYVLSISSGGGGSGGGEDACSHDATDPDCWSSEQGSFVWQDAVDQCDNFSGEGSGDWHLPSEVELWAGWEALGSEGFPNSLYWSSTVFGGDAVNLRTFMDPPDIFPNFMSDLDSVRCLR